MKITRKQLKRLIESIFIHGDSIPGRLGLQMKPDTKKLGINYTALVLDHGSQIALMQHIPQQYLQPKIYCHHMTLISPTVQKNRRYPEHFLNMPATITVNAIVMDDKVAAAVVDPAMGDAPHLPIDGPAFPHVTIATNDTKRIGEKGGKPYMSNNLDLRTAIPINPITLTGVIREL